MTHRLSRGGAEQDIHTTPLTAAHSWCWLKKKRQQQGVRLSSKAYYVRRKNATNAASQQLLVSFCNAINIST